MKVRNLFGGDSFLGLFTLDTGGIIIGAQRCWIFLKGNSTNYQKYCELCTRKYPESHTTAQGALTNATDKDISCTFVSKIPFFLIFLGMIILSIIGAIAHYRLMKGIEENDHKKTRLARGYYMFYIGLRAILFIVFLIWCFFNGKMLWPAIFSLVLLLIDLYAYSIIDKLRVKYEHTPPVNTAQTTQFFNEQESLLELQIYQSELKF
ncbi:hypothetical protein PVAND_016191 [Polypedilum vanderplanki]|uniref:Uncharacterized protein n=1 Tax=Polypedilum vanderplanki TaxID=319348 RepID=A0A9J6BEE2_POLVA|nr:hypothetical protein PVAND_016191 [Polypedilum vanderplanki]